MSETKYAKNQIESIVVGQQPDTNIHDRIIAKQVDLLYDNQPFAIVSTFLVMTITLLFLYTPEIKQALTLQYLLFSLVYGYRCFFNWQYVTYRKNGTINVKKAEKYYLNGILVSGIAWATITMVTFPLVDLKGQILLLIVLMGIAAAAHTTMGFQLKPILSFILLLELPLLFAVYVSEFPNTAAMFVAIIVHSLFMMRASFLFYKSSYKMLRANEIAMLREQELEIQSADANAANDAKSEFLSRMSHELRTPLNAVLGMNELLMRDKKEPLSIKQRDRIEKVNKAGKHLLSIVDDVLDLSRVEAGNMDINLKLTDCQNVVNDSIKLIEHKALKRDITISTDISQSDIFVMADAIRLKQVVVNLLDNAVKYNKRGGLITVVIGIVAQSTIRISIVDTGYGISKVSAKELFQPFSRLGAEQLGIDGTGIGLSLCKHLVELMHGKIDMESQKGKGCCFWIELPQIVGDNILEDEIFAEVTDINFESDSEQSITILLVEDNLVNCEVAVDMLEELGFNVEVVNNGVQALDTFNRNHHDLILMDCEMPEMDGFAATSYIREKEILSNHKRTPIVALTAHAVTGAKDRCFASGMDDFLSKPFSMPSLNHMLNKWLKSKTKTVADVDVIIEEELIINSQENVLDNKIISRLQSRKNKDGKNLVNKVVNIYLDQSNKLLEELTDATKKSDIDKVRTISHALKSSSTNVGATGLSNLCKEVEHHCELGSINIPLVKKVHTSYIDVEKALHSVLQNF